MLLMKKDMGGAATVLSIAQMVIGAKLKVRLRVLIPAVENSISGTAFRPGDVLHEPQGPHGRDRQHGCGRPPVLADALSLADDEKPELLLDFATLTGAARVALGPDLPPFYTDDETLAVDVARPAAPSMIPCGGCRSGSPTISMLDFEDRRHEQRDDRRVRGLRHGGAVPQALRGAGQGLGAFRHLWLGARGKAGPPLRREPQAARLVFALLQDRYGS